MSIRVYRHAEQWWYAPPHINAKRISEGAAPSVGQWGQYYASGVVETYDVPGHNPVAYGETADQRWWVNVNGSNEVFYTDTEDEAIAVATTLLRLDGG